MKKTKKKKIQLPKRGQRAKKNKKNKRQVFSYRVFIACFIGVLKQAFFYYDSMKQNEVKRQDPSQAGQEKSQEGYWGAMAIQTK